MTSTCSYYFFSFIFLFLFKCENLSAQFLWKASAESGIYNASGEDVEHDNEILNRLIVQAGYKYNQTQRIIKINTKITPEFYGLKNELFTLKFIADGYYEQQEKDFDWSINLSTQNYKYSEKNFDVSYKNYLINGRLSWFYSPVVMIEVEAGYAYRNLNTNTQTELDLFNLEGSAIHFFNPYLRAGVGIYFEKFSHSYKYHIFFQYNNEKNNGWRAGPQIQLNYLKKFIFTSEYQFLIHESKITKYPSYEQWFRLLAGKTFYSDYSVFILVEYYKRHFEYSETKNIDFLYIPINKENRYYFKMAYDVNDKMEIYVKSGYFEKQLFYMGNTLSGWHGLLGIEIHN